MAEQNTGCLHDYQILSRDAKLIADADVFIINGAGMETFLEDVYMSNENLKIVDSSKGVTLIENCDEHHENHEEETHHEHNHSVNSHIWMSPENAKIQVDNIAENLASYYPQYKDIIEENFRLIYVGITRAKKKLVLSSARNYKFFNRLQQKEESEIFEGLEEFWLR